MDKKALKKYLKRSDLAIEGNTATWHLSMEGNIQGTYTGLFRFKCFLSPSEKLAMGRDYRELLGANASLAYKHEDDLAFALAQLKYRVIDSPPFWSSAEGINGMKGDIPDAEIIMNVLDAAMAAEWKYLAELHKRKDESLKRAKDAAEKLLNVKEEIVEENPGEGEA